MYLTFHSFSQMWMSVCKTRVLIFATTHLVVIFVAVRLVIDCMQIKGIAQVITAF